MTVYSNVTGYSNMTVYSNMTLYSNVTVYSNMPVYSNMTVYSNMAVYSNMTVSLHQSATSVLPILQTTSSQIWLKKVSVYAVTLCPGLFAVPNNIIVCLPCLLNNTVRN